MKKFIKSLQLALIAALTAVMIFAMTACGASGTLGSFVSAVKSGNAEKASSYVSGSVAVSYPKDEIEAYLWDKTVKSFSYKVEETNEDKDKGTVTIKISYSMISQAAVRAKILANGTLFNYTKDDINKAVKDVKKTESTATILFSTNDDGKVMMNQVSAVALLGIIVG